MTALGNRGFLLLNGVSPRDRRAVLLGAAVVLPGLAFMFGVKPYRAAMEDARDRLAAEEELLEREMELLGSREVLPGEVERLEAEARSFEAGLVRAASGVLAEAELTDFLESAAVRNRVLLEEIRGGELGRGEEPPPGLSVVRLHLRGESDMEGILSFLDEIERSDLFLRVRGLALEPQTARVASNDEENAAPVPVPTGVVEIQLIVDGFARVSENGS
jgi:hypothetical protein